MRSRLSRSRGTTVVELAIGFTILTVIFAIGMELYSKGSKGSAKGTWRVQTVTAMRNGLRVMQDMLARSSYPTAIDISNYYEGPAATWGLTINTATANSAQGAGTAYSYTDVRNVLVFFVCTPVQQTTAANSPGSCLKTTLSLTAGTLRPNNKNLVMAQERAAVTLGGGGVTVGGFTALEPQVLMRDVDSVVVATTGTTTEKSVLELTVTCRDPYDQQMTLHETVKVTLNVAIRIQ